MTGRLTRVFSLARLGFCSISASPTPASFIYPAFQLDTRDQTLTIGFKQVSNIFSFYSTLGIIIIIIIYTVHSDHHYHHDSSSSAATLSYLPPSPAPPL